MEANNSSSAPSNGNNGSDDKNEVEKKTLTFDDIDPKTWWDAKCDRFDHKLKLNDTFDGALNNPTYYGYSGDETTSAMQKAARRGLYV